MGTSKIHAQRLASGILSRRGGFRSEFLDFDRGIRVGHLEPSERITQLLKARLAERHGCRMLCDRWGRGVYWQWICWVPEPNRRAKPSSSGHNFASAKFFVAIDREGRTFQSGLQIERAPVRPPEDDWGIRVEKDWDWHVFRRALRGERLPRLIASLLREGFRVRVGPFESLTEFDRRAWDPAACLRRTRFSPPEWGGFQLFWPMSEREVRDSAGEDIVDAVEAVFEAVAPAMQLCMFAPCLRLGEGGAAPRQGTVAR